VAHLISSRAVGGAEKVMKALCSGATAHGWEAVVVNPFEDSSVADEFREFFGTVPYFARDTHSSVQLLSSRGWARSTLRGLEPAVVHVHNSPAAILAATMAQSRGPSWLLTHHHGPLFDLQGRPARAAVDRWATRRLGHAVAVSSEVREYLIGRCGIPEKDATLIYNGWGGQPLPRTGESHPPTVVCVAGFRREKGHEVLVRAFAEVARRVPRARLALLGGGVLEPEVRAQVAASGLDGSVDFYGAVGDVWPFLAAADVFAMASWSDAMSVAMLEAMAAALPIVATSTGSARELVQDGVSGWLVAPGDHVALAERLVRLLTDPITCTDFGRVAAQAAADKSEPIMVAKYYQVYEVLAGQTVPPDGSA
jgi:glycosyltransferase involved in cell wall biosynthesis